MLRLLFLQGIHLLLFIIIIALLITHRDANGNDTKSFSVCSRVAEALNQEIYKSGGLLNTHNKFMNTYCYSRADNYLLFIKLRPNCCQYLVREKKR